MWLSSCVLSKVFHWYPKLWAYPSLGTNLAIERTIGNSFPHDVQVNFPSEMAPFFSAGEADSTRRGAPHPMHLSHSTDFKFIPGRSSLTPIRFQPLDPSSARIQNVPRNFILNKSRVPTLPRWDVPATAQR